MSDEEKKTLLENLKFEREHEQEFIPCPLCGWDQFKPLLEEHRFLIVRCRGCGLVFVNPRPNREALKEFYEHYFPPESESLWQRQMSKIFAKEGLEKIHDLRSKGILRTSQRPRLLDIGCGMGFFLDLMRKQGWEVAGVEPAPYAVQYAREKLGLGVVEGTIEIAHFGESFDVITLWYVLEHVPNPGEILDSIAMFLKPGGLLIIRVPNQNVTVDRILSALGLGKFFLMNPPRHLFDYSPGTIGKFLRKRGFEIMEFRNSYPRGTGTFLELLRRRLWYYLFQGVYFLSGKKILRGSSITIYARKK